MFTNTGGVVVFAAIGAFTGGVVVQLLKLELVGSFRLCACSVGIAMALAVVSLLGCSDEILVGVDSPYFNETYF